MTATYTAELTAIGQLEQQLNEQNVSLKPYELLFDCWLKSSPKRRQTTRDDYWHVARSFADITGRLPLADITRKDVVAFRDHLLEQGLSATTAGHRVAVLKTLFNVGIEYELLPANPAAQIRTPKFEGKSRIAFSVDDMQRIFQSDIYTANYIPQVGGRHACYWLPLLALFTGARVEELAQLLVEDVHHVAELGHYINISDDAAHAQLKNTASRRRVPVHPILIACGFTDYVQQIKPNKFLFPHLKPNPRGKLGGYFSAFFSIYLRQRVGITDKRKVFHSFRHTFKDVCRRVGIEEAVHDALTGHTSSSASRKYGNELYPLEPLFDAMQRYEIRELDLTHLYKRPLENPLRNSELKLISAFYGVTVAFVANRVRKVLAPFVVALCDGAEVGVDVASSSVIFGQLPCNKQLLVDAWIEIHREEIIASWNVGKMTGDYCKVDPLR